MILGVTGTNGAGKGAVVEYLVSKKGFTHYSARSLFMEEVARRGLPTNRDTITDTANDLRAKHGPAYAVETLLANAQARGGDAAIESIRTLGELEVLRRAGGRLIAVDTDPRIRYERVVLRGSETDKIDFDTFIAQEARELRSDDPNKQNLLGVIAHADYRLENNGTLEELHAKLDALFTNQDLFHERRFKK